MTTTRTRPIVTVAFAASVAVLAGLTGTQATACPPEIMFDSVTGEALPQGDLADALAEIEGQTRRIFFLADAGR